jgi:hypothetical protein
MQAATRILKTMFIVTITGYGLPTRHAPNDVLHLKKWPIKIATSRTKKGNFLK